MTQIAGLPLLMVIAVDVGAPLQLGTRRCIPLLGGSVEGAYRGRVVPGGTDWQTIGADGTLEISARYALELEQGLVEVRSDGLRSGSPEVLARLAAGEAVPPDQYYFRTAMRFHSASPALAELNSLLAVAAGERRADSVRLSVHRIP